MSDIDPQQFEQLCDDVAFVKGDVSDMKKALKGSEEYSQKGALQRLDETEERSWANKHTIDRVWYYVIGAGASLAGLLKGIELLI